GALVNLLTNAWHALDARGPASFDAPDSGADLELVTQKGAGARVVILVRDRGVGIEAENLPRVWEPYFTTRRAGTGLGRAIVRNVIDGLGGTITIDSRPGAGTEVRIELPERPASVPARPTERTA